MDNRVPDSGLAESSDAWRRDGLRFRCTQCGNCCTGSPGYVWVCDEDVHAIADYLDKPIGEIRLLFTRPARGKVSLTEYPNGDCVFFDGNTRRCSIYPVRPAQCREWPFWERNVASRADWEETQRTCPGAGTGDLYSLQQIQAAVRRAGV